eukprot:256546-Rhodomonas_salina.1
MHNCAVPGGTCTDTLDSFQCACDAGYQGDGVACTVCSGGVYCPLVVVSKSWQSCCVALFFCH